jgi:hypothetical protein
MEKYMNCQRFQCYFSKNNKPKSLTDVKTLIGNPDAWVETTYLLHEEDREFYYIPKCDINGIVLIVTVDMFDKLGTYIRGNWGWNTISTIDVPEMENCGRGQVSLSIELLPNDTNLTKWTSSDVASLVSSSIKL